MKPGEARHGAREATPSNVLHAPSAAAWVRLVWLSHTSACVQGAWPPHAPPAGLNFDGAVRRTDPNASARQPTCLSVTRVGCSRSVPWGLGCGAGL